MYGLNVTLQSKTTCRSCGYPATETQPIDESPWLYERTACNEVLKLPPGIVVFTALLGPSLVRRCKKEEIVASEGRFGPGADIRDFSVM